jgi:sugar phosphate isomerase/epimerase
MAILKAQASLTREALCHNQSMTPRSRRTFLKTAALAPAARSLTSAADSLQSIGVQLYTVRSVLPAKPLDTLEAIQAIGYSECEATQDGLDKIWSSLKQTKLAAVSLHMNSALFSPGKEAELQRAIDDAKRRGFEYVVYPYVPVPERAGLEGIRRLAARLNAAGEKCHAAGLKLCYHNHAFEFEPIQGTTPFETLVHETNPENVGLELDVFWASVAGHDPVDILNHHSSRIRLVHLKDKALGTPVQYNESVPRTAFKEVGSGVLDFPAILRAAAHAGVKHYFVEQDQTPGDPIASLRESYEYLRRVKF